MTDPRAVDLLPADAQVPLPTNWYDVVNLDLPYENKDILDAIIQGVTDNRFQRIGKPIGIVKAMELVAEDVAEQWWEVNDAFLNDNLTPDQKAAAANRITFAIHDTANIPKFDSNMATKDSPMEVIQPTFTYDIIKMAPGSLTSRKFGGNKELGARLRFFAQLNGYQYPVSAKSKEYRVLIRAYAHTNTLATLMIEGLENYIETRRGFFFGLGIQHIHIEDSDTALQYDTRGQIPYKQATLYIRSEKWFVGKAIPLIKSVTMDWQTAFTNI